MIGPSSVATFSVRWRSLKLLFLAAALKAYGACAWVPTARGLAVPCPRRLVNENTCASAQDRSRSVALSMGLRSFIGRRIGRRHEGDARDDEGDVPSPSFNPPPELTHDIDDLNDSSVSVDPHPNNGWKPSMHPDHRKPPVRMGEDPSSKEINVLSLDRHESVQERINRVKSGIMTDEEKAAYLKSALASGSSPDSRLPLRPPVANSEQEVRASPFPGDPIFYRSVAGGRISNDLVDRAGVDVQKKKRDYLDMVTNPHRFDVYRTTGSSNKDVREDDTTDQWIKDSLESTSKAAKADQDKSPSKIPFVPLTAKEVAKKNPISPLPTDLGERLAAAANAEESRKQAQQERLSKEIEEETRRQEIDRRVQEEERLRHAAMVAQYQEKKMRNQMLSPKEEAALKRLEEEKMKEMTKIQDDYWVQKLAAEKEAKERQDEMERHKGYLKSGSAQSARALDAFLKKSIKTATASESAKTQSPPMSATDDEGKAGVPDKSTEAPCSNDEASESTSGNAGQISQPLSASDLNDVRTMNQPRRIATMQRFKGKDAGDEQIRRLKELNSPLPNSKPQTRLSSDPPPFQPQRSLSTPTPTPTNKDKPLSLNNLMRNDLNDVRNPPKKKYAVAEKANGAPPIKPSTGGPPPPTTPLPQNNVPQTFGSPPRQAANQPAQAPEPQRKKGPIRMQLPTLEDEYDEENGIDSRANPGLSIGDVLKKSASDDGQIDQDERSKKWGIDMSRFT